METRVKIFKTSKAAEAALSRLVDCPDAHVRRDNLTNGYVILGHSEECNCALCPILWEDGTMA